MTERGQPQEGSCWDASVKSAHHDASELLTATVVADAVGPRDVKSPKPEPRCSHALRAVAGEGGDEWRIGRDRESTNAAKRASLLWSKCRSGGEPS